MVLLKKHRQHTRKHKLTQFFVLNCNFRRKQFMEGDPVINLWTIWLSAVPAGRDTANV